MTLKILTVKEKNHVTKRLKTQFGITHVDGLLVQRGAERLFLFVGALTPKELLALDQNVPIERAGIYIGKLQDNEIRLSIDGTHHFKDQITKNIIELDEHQTDEWMHGSEILLKTNNQGFVAVKHKDDFLGCAKASKEKITNFVPKARRLKFKS